MAAIDPKQILEKQVASYLADLYKSPEYKGTSARISARALRDMAKRGIRLEGSGRGSSYLNKLEAKLRAQVETSQVKGKKIATKERRFKERRKELRGRAEERRVEKSKARKAKQTPKGGLSKTEKYFARKSAEAHVSGRKGLELPERRATPRTKPLVGLSEAEKQVLSKPSLLRRLATRFGKLGRLSSPAGIAATAYETTALTREGLRRLARERAERTGLAPRSREL
jgi:hypothetical protein